MCRHSSLNSMQPTGKWDKETPDTMTKLSKPLLGCCIIPRTFMEEEEEEEEFIKLNWGMIWTNVTWLSSLNLKRRHRHMFSVHYRHHWPGTRSKELFTRTGKETIYPFPRWRAVTGIYVADLHDLQLDLKQRKPPHHSLNSHGMKPWGDKMHAQTIGGRHSFKLETW